MRCGLACSIYMCCVAAASSFSLVRTGTLLPMAYFKSAFKHRRHLPQASSQARAVTKARVLAKHSSSQADDHMGPCPDCLPRMPMVAQRVARTVGTPCPRRRSTAARSVVICFMPPNARARGAHALGFQTDSGRLKTACSSYRPRMNNASSSLSVR